MLCTDGNLSYKGIAKELDVDHKRLIGNDNQRVIDTLNIASVDNIEIVKTPLGYCFNYASIWLYGCGGSVDMPYVIDAEEVSKTINISVE